MSTHLGVYGGAVGFGGLEGVLFGGHFLLARGVLLTLGLLLLRAAVATVRRGGGRGGRGHGSPPLLGRTVRQKIIYIRKK